MKRQWVEPSHAMELNHVKSISNPRQTPEGIFYPDYQLPDYDTEVIPESRRQLDSYQQDSYGYTFLEQWEMSDGTKYHILHGVAAERKVDIPVIKDTAWGTQVKGLNTDVGRKLLSLGYDFLIKGPEIGTTIPLSHSAYNTHKVLDYAENLGWFDTEQVALEGYSRGSMIGFGTNAYARRFNRNIIYSNLTDPCIALPVGFNRPTLEKAAKFGNELGSMIIQLALMSNRPKRASHLAETIDSSIPGLQQFVRTGIPLFNGEAGAMASQTPLDLKATVCFFNQSIGNDSAYYLSILGDRPYVRFVHPEGSHLRAIDARIIGNIAVRFSRLANQLAEGRSPEELDYNIIHMARSDTIRLPQAA